MSFYIFSVWGYLSVLLWLSALGLFGLHFRRQPRRWLCHYALAVLLIAALLARVNSRWHVNRLQVDRSEEIAAAAARQAAARQMAEDERAGDVAQIRFAEDGAADFLDLAGLDEADLKYVGRFDDTVTPEWQQQRQRGAARSPTDRRSLDDMLDTTEREGGVDTGGMEEEPHVIMLPERMVALAHRLDTLNLQWVRLLLLGALGLVLYDYLARTNRYVEAYFPLPVPSLWTSSVVPLPETWSRGVTPRRRVAQELEWIVRRGDVFLYVTDKTAAATALPSHLARLPMGKWPIDVIHVAAEDALVSDRFVFEGLWYNQACFVVDAPDRAANMLAQFVAHLSERRATKAKVRQTVHIIWDIEGFLLPDFWDDLVWLSGRAGMCVWNMPETKVG